MYLWRCFNFDSFMMYLHVRLLIFPVLYYNRKSVLLIWRGMRWNYIRVSPSPRRNEITRSWDLGPILLSWGIIIKTTEIIRWKPLSLFMHVMSLPWNFGDIYEDMLLSLTRLTMSALEYDSWLYFAVVNLGFVSGGRRSLEMVWCYDLGDLYG